MMWEVRRYSEIWSTDGAYVASCGSKEIAEYIVRLHNQAIEGT